MTTDTATIEVLHRAYAAQADALVASHFQELNTALAKLYQALEERGVPAAWLPRTVEDLLHRLAAKNLPRVDA